MRNVGTPFRLRQYMGLILKKQSSAYTIQLNNIRTRGASRYSGARSSQWNLDSLYNHFVGTAREWILRRIICWSQFGGAMKRNTGLHFILSLFILFLSIVSDDSAKHSAFSANAFVFSVYNPSGAYLLIFLIALTMQRISAMFTHHQFPIPFQPSPAFVICFFHCQYGHEFRQRDSRISSPCSFGLVRRDRRSSVTRRRNWTSATSFGRPLLFLWNDLPPDRRPFVSSVWTSARGLLQVLWHLRRIYGRNGSFRIIPFCALHHATFIRCFDSSISNGNRRGCRCDRSV